MTRDDLLAGLYRARRELTRLVIATAPHADEQDLLELLLDERDLLVWQINRIDLSELTASVAQMTAACAVVDHATDQLKSLTSTIANVNKALALSAEIIGVAGGIASKGLL